VAPPESGSRGIHYSLFSAGRKEKETGTASAWLRSPRPSAFERVLAAKLPQQSAGSPVGLKSGLGDKSLAAARSGGAKNNNNNKNGNTGNSRRRVTDTKTAHSLPVPAPLGLARVQPFAPAQRQLGEGDPSPVVGYGDPGAAGGGLGDSGSPRNLSQPCVRALG